MPERPILPWGQQRAHPLLVLLGVLMVPLVAMFDYLAGPEFAFSIFYLIPIVAVARWGDWTSAWFTAVLAALAWMVIDVLAGPPYSTFLAPVWNTFTRLAFFSIALLAMRGYYGRLASAEIRALSDPLTGLPNRQYLRILLGAARARLERYNRPLTLAYLDVDDFKRVNDQHGHQAGDQVLRRIAQIMSESTRDVDTVVRIGGDEFVMLLPEARPEEAKLVLERVRRALLGMTVGGTTEVSMSIGACTFYRPMESVDEMISEADERMYRVKRSGKNTVIIDEVW
jgi:diguanylate cyclase (GGDEF)-like protein